jgi:hypothetical protein
MSGALIILIGIFIIAGRSAAQTVSPSSWKQTSYIKASNSADGDQHGYAIALSGDGNTLAAGAPMNSSLGTGVNDRRGNKVDDSSYNSGAVYVYVREGAVWRQQAFIKASNAGSNDQFGNALAISADGNTLAVAAVFEDSAATGINGRQADNSSEQSGAVYIFARKGSTWIQQAYVKASNTGERDDGDTFGYTIGLSDDGNTLAIGAPSEDGGSSGINGNPADNSAIGAGAVYVFVRSAAAWSQQAYVKSANARGNSLFGYSVALSNNGDTLAIGAFDEDMGRGALYIFARQGGVWSQQARLQASNGERQDSLGAWVAISDDGNTVAAGALDEDSFLTGVVSADQGANDQSADTSAGAAYIFSRTGSTWSQQAFIKASNTGKEDWFGVRLALSGDGNTLAVGAPNEDSSAKGIGGRQDNDSAGEAGAVYVYTRTGSTWTHQVYLKGANTEQFDEFGSSVALSKDGRMLAVGARFKETLGALYVFGSSHNKHKKHKIIFCVFCASCG